MNEDQQEESDILVQFLCLFSAAIRHSSAKRGGTNCLSDIALQPPLPPTFLYLTICWHALFAGGNLFLLRELIWVGLKYLSVRSFKKRLT